MPPAGVGGCTRTGMVEVIFPVCSTRRVCTDVTQGCVTRNRYVTCCVSPYRVTYHTPSSLHRHHLNLNFYHCARQPIATFLPTIWVGHTTIRSDNFISSHCGCLSMLFSLSPNLEAPSVQRQAVKCQHPGARCQRVSIIRTAYI
jgi:hypothetical protein